MLIELCVLCSKTGCTKTQFLGAVLGIPVCFFSLLPPPSTLTGAIKLNQISNGSCCASYDAVADDDAGDDDYYYYDTTTATTNTAAASAAMLNMRKLVIRASIVCVCVFAWPVQPHGCRAHWCAHICMVVAVLCMM